MDSLMDSPNVRALRDKADHVMQVWLLQPYKQRKFRFLGLVLMIFLLFSAMWTFFSLMVVPDNNSYFATTTKKPAVIIDPGKSLIPEKIWQIFFEDEDCDPENLRETKSWLARNINYQ